MADAVVRVYVDGELKARLDPPASYDAWVRPEPDRPVHVVVEADES